jgi:NTE family protein
VSDPIQKKAPLTGLVLSGGGARGAYEAGIVQGMMEVLRPTRPIFDVLTGTSVGALNATFLAAHADLPDMNALGLAEHWRKLEVSRHLRLDMRGVLGWKRDWGRAEDDDDKLPRLAGRSLLDPRALEDIVKDGVPWERLHNNVAASRVQALIIAALHIATGRTTLFAELAPGVELKAVADPRRGQVLEKLTADHVLASAAIPLVFPSRRIGQAFFCDGGVRFNTPISPALRAGAKRLVVVSTLSQEAPPTDTTPLEDRIQAYNSPVFVIGKVLNALLLDPLRYDLQVLQRLNEIVTVLEQVLPPHELQAVQEVITRNRGLPYKRVQTLLFRPSRDVGKMARVRASKLQSSRFSSWLIARTATLGALWESDLLSFILFDSEFAEELIQLGRSDALAQAREIEAFFREGA